jgi:hypothetical protein
MLIVIDILCVYVLNVDVLLFSTGSQDVLIKMPINIPFFESAPSPKCYVAGVLKETRNLWRSCAVMYNGESVEALCLEVAIRDCHPSFELLEDLCSMRVNICAGKH